MCTGHRTFVGETSLQVLYNNAGTIRSIINAMKPFNPDAILVIVTNPVDILTTLAQEIAGLPKNQVIGSGTFVDSVRLRGLLAEKIGVSLPV
jgi:L-lactate dehydrogenase